MVYLDIFDSAADQLGRARLVIKYQVVYRPLNFLERSLCDAVLSDLDEIFDRDLVTHNRLYAYGRFWKTAIWLIYRNRLLAILRRRRGYRYWI
jgi:hypothetical protein